MAGNIGIIQLKEHQEIEGEAKSIVQSLGIELVETPYQKAPKFLGVTPDYKASYFIGADWLSDDLPIVITPKMENIDYMKMFLCALDFELPSDYFSLFYGINFDKKEIEHDGLKDEVTPLLIIHFLSTVKRLLKRGLKKDYVLREENLNSKVKGHIQLSKNIQKNIIPQRLDRTYCRFQEYTVNHPENRLLKKALLFVERYLSQHAELNSINRLRSELNSSLSHFEVVSDQIELSQIRTIANNKLYREHAEAVKLARQILRRFSYSIHAVSSNSQKVPAFWMDMSRLYEIYVYSLLNRAYRDKIEFQVPGYRGTAVDFIKKDQNLIIDTKYKPHYGNGNRGIVDDIRQISGYARDKKILQRLHEASINEDFVPQCLIIYPDKDERLIDSEDEEKDKEVKGFEGKDLINEAVRIKAFHKFYKLSVPLPVIETYN
jgi:5-methylcytosine-specific restriction enzyme subunit McrC